MVQFLKDKERCEYLQKYFLEQGILETEIKVQKAKDYTKDLNKGDHFDYEEVNYKVGKFQSKWPKEITKPRPIDWIAMQWPGGDGDQSKPPTPWTYELVLLNKDFNIKKENVSPS